MGKQQKTTTKPPFDPKPYQVKEVKGDLDEEDDWDIDLQDKPQESIRKDRVGVEGPEGEEIVPDAQPEHQPQIQSAAASPPSPRKSGRLRKKTGEVGQGSY